MHRSIGSTDTSGSQDNITILRLLENEEYKENLQKQI